MHKKNKILPSVVTGVVLLCAVLVVAHQCCSSTNTSGGEYTESLFGAAMTSDPSGANTLAAKLPIWLTENWTNDNTMYTKVENEVATSPLSPKALEVAAQINAEKNPRSALAQFRWAFPLWKSIATDQPSSKRASTRSAMFYALARADSPDTYRYARLRYLVSPSAVKGANIGERLLRQDPQDDEVKFNLVVDHAFGVGTNGNPKSKARALALCQQLFKADPKRAKNYSVLGTVYEMSYSNKHNRADGLAAIAAARSYLRLIDPKTEYAQMKRDGISELKADLARDKQ